MINCINIKIVLRVCCIYFFYKAYVYFQSREFYFTPSLLIIKNKQGVPQPRVLCHVISKWKKNQEADSSCGPTQKLMKQRIPESILR